MIKGRRRSRRLAVAAGATNMAITSTTPTKRKATTEASATSTSSPVCTQATGTPLAAAISGS